MTKNKNLKYNVKEDTSLIDIQKQLSQINEKLFNVMQKDDGSLKYMIKETVNQMKNDLLNVLENRVEKLEAKLFDREESRLVKQS